MLDNFRTQKIIWDRANKKIFEAIEASSGDSNGRKLVVQVINQETTEVLSGTTLSLGWKSRNGAKGLDAFDTVDASKGIFEIYYTTEMLSNIGNIEASLVLINSTSRIESSAFTISVRPSTVDDEYVESENSFTALTQALVKVNDFDARLAQKADKGNISVNDINKNLGKLDGSFFTEEFNQLLSNGELNVTNLLDGSVTEEKLADKSTTLNKLGNDLTTSGKPVNLLKWTEADLEFTGFYDANGNLNTTLAHMVTTPPIPVVPNLEYSKIRANTRPELSFWDEALNFVAGFTIIGSASIQTFVVPNDERIKYVRFGGSRERTDEYMLIQGAALEYPPQYIPYSEVVLQADKKIESIPRYSYNLVDPKKIINSGRFNTGGAFSQSTTYNSTGLIEVEPNEILRSRSVGPIVTFWDDDFKYVTTQPSHSFIKVPNNSSIKYMRVSLNGSTASQAMIVRGLELPDEYIPYEEVVSKADIMTVNSTIEGVENIFESEGNVLDLNDISVGIYYDANTGQEKALGSWGTTGYIPVKPGEVFSKPSWSDMQHVTFWDDNHNFVSGNFIAQSTMINVPDIVSIKYMRVSLVLSSFTDDIGIFKGIEYPQHKYVIKEGVYVREKPKYRVRPSTHIKNPILTRYDVTDRTGVRGVADPFLVVDKGRYHLFFEVIHTETEEIGHAYSDDLIDWTYTQIVLSKQEHGHRSAYPNVFKVDGEWYMIPDAGAGVMVYKATNFPYEWEFVMNLIPNGVDTNVFKFDGVWYMTTSSLSRGVELYVNTSGNWLNNEWQLHPAGLIIPNDDITGGRRGAGKQRILDDCVYLPIQGTPPGAPYGQRTDLYKIINLTPTTAEAVNLGVLTEAQGGDRWNSNTMHHISHEKCLEKNVYVVDGTDGAGLGYTIGLYEDNI